MTRNTPLQDDDSTVRHYSADGTLTVVRDEETNEHIIKSRGRDRGDKWTRRVPATRTTVELGEQLWSIPDNWTEYYRLKAEHGHDRGIYQIPESGDSVLVTLSHKNSYITDAYHTVKEVGSITWSARVDVDQDALSEALDFVNDHADEFEEDIVDVLVYLRENPRDAVEAAEEDAEMCAPEAVEDWESVPVSEFDPFRVSFRTDGGVVSHPEHGPKSDIMTQVRDLLGDFGIVPPSPLVSVTVQ